MSPADFERALEHLFVGLHKRRGIKRSRITARKTFWYKLYLFLRRVGATDVAHRWMNGKPWVRVYVDGSAFCALKIKAMSDEGFVAMYKAQQRQQEVERVRTLKQRAKTISADEIEVPDPVRLSR